MKYVDLGLSVLWADCNIGANTPEEYGNYYKWDDIPKEYEIPTKEQQDELREKCTWEWTTQKGVRGCKVTSKVNGNSIFLPAAGCRSSNGNLCYSCINGYYRSSSLEARYSGNPYYVYFSSSHVDWSNCLGSYYEQSVRTIKSKTNFKNKTTMTLAEVNKIFPLKSGMCLELFSNNNRKRVILFQYGNGEMCCTDYNDQCSWYPSDSLNYNKQFDTIKVYQSPTVSAIFSGVDLIFNSDDYKVKELTMQEIADKFGIKVENLRIKE